MNGNCNTQRGFTLVELSIVLVIIGLLIGGVLVGQDLIQSAQSRAMVAQISRYNAAVKVFYDKFQAIPGDMALVTAQQNGFYVTDCNGNGVAAQRDGNGLIDGKGAPYILDQAVGETALFWQDLSSPIAGNLIEGSYSTAAYCSLLPFSTISGTLLSLWFPPAKIGQQNYVYVYEANGYNWYGVSAVTSITTSATLYSNTSIPVTQAYNIDRKIDDGIPTTGSVVAVYIAGSQTATSNAPNNTSDNTTTCYNTTGPAYSMSSTAHYGNGSNCALSFRFP